MVESIQIFHYHYVNNHLYKEINYPQIDIVKLEDNILDSLGVGLLNIVVSRNNFIHNPIVSVNEEVSMDEKVYFFVPDLYLLDPQEKIFLEVETNYYEVRFEVLFFSIDINIDCALSQRTFDL